MFFKEIMIKGHETVWSGKGNKERFISNYIQFALPIIEQKKSIKKVLDLGCGPCKGAAFLLQEKGFDVYGFDASPTAIKKCSEKIDLSKLKIGNMYEPLPYPNNFFDCIVCFQAIQHSRKKGIQNALKEISRILKKDGIFFLSSMLRNYIQKKNNSFFSSKGNEWKKIEKNTFVQIKGPEKGIIHYFFEKKELEEELKKFFDVKEIKEIKKNKYFVHAKRI